VKALNAIAIPRKHNIKPRRARGLKKADRLDIFFFM
jgi:hypothetical protein